MLTLTACGNLAVESLAFATTDAEPTVLRLATPRIAGFEDVIARWEREHPTARVELVVRNVDDHHRSLLDDGDAGGLFDVVAFDSSYGPDMRENPELFVDLRTLDDPPQSSDYLAARFDEGIADSGQLIGVPLDVDSSALLVRNDLVDESIVEQLHEASTWCDIVVAGDQFSDATNQAFFPNTEDLVAAMLAQTRTSFVDEAGALLAEDTAELEYVFDIAMIAIGEGPLHGEPCRNTDEVQRIARNLEFDTVEWRDDLRSDSFAAIVAPWSYQQRIVNAAPETAGAWTTIALPEGSFADGTASDGGLQLAIPADVENLELAYDLVLTLTSAPIQQNAFMGGSGPLPAASELHDGGSLNPPSDSFFVDTSGASFYSRAATGRPSQLATPERRVVIEAVLDAVTRVGNGSQSPAEAWASMGEELAQTLG